MKKLFKIFFLTAIALMSFSIVSHAAEEAVINAINYTSGSVSTKMSNGTSVTMAGAKTAGYSINFAKSPNSLTLVVGTTTGSGNNVEVRLDDPKNGELLGTINTKEWASASWSKVKCTLMLKQDISGPHTIHLSFKGGNHDFHEIIFTIPEADDMYGKFSLKDRFTDIEDSPARMEINLLAELGMIKAIKDDGSNEFDGAALATKREFINSLYAFYGSKLPAADTELPFTDINKDDVDYDKISWLYTAGVLKVPNNGRLNPDGGLSFDDACAMLCRLLGYEYRYEAGKSYVSIAKSLGLLRGIPQTTVNLKRLDMAVMLYNTLESDYDEICGIRLDGGIIFDTNEYVLESTADIYLGTGVVSASFTNDLYDAGSTAAEGAVEIGGKTYLHGDTVAMNYLGFNCRFFYKDDNGRRTLLAIWPHEDVNYVQLNTKDYAINEVTSSVISYYDTDDDIEKCTITDSTVVMYNGRPTGDAISVLIGNTEDFRGEILLVDNDGDKKYDVVFIEQSQTMIFGGVNDSGIYDLLTGQVVNVGDIDDAKVYSGSVKYGWSIIKAGDIIDVYRSKNRTGDILTRVYISDNEVVGVIDEMVDDKLVFEDGTAYEPYIVTVKNPTVGMTVVLKLNSYGNYVDYSTEIGEKLGLVISCGKGDWSGFNKELGIRLLNEENELVNLYFGDKVYADGVLCRTPEELYSGTGSFTGGISTRLSENSVIRYSLNSDGEIFMIDTKESGAGGSKDTLTLLLEPHPTYGYNIRGTIITNTSLLELCPLKSGYKVIKIDTAAGETAYEFIGPFSQSDQARKLTAYSTEGGTVKADLLVWTFSASTTTNNHFVLETKGMSLNDEGDAEIMLKGTDANGEVTYYVDDNVYRANAAFKAKVDALMPGDLVQTALTSKGKISNITIRYMRDGASSRADGAVVPSLSSEKHIMTRNDVEGKQYWCEIIDREDNILIARRMNAGAWEEFYIDCTSIKVITCENESGVYKTTLNGQDTSSLTVGTQMVACCKSYAYVPYLAVVYK